MAIKASFFLQLVQRTLKLAVSLEANDFLQHCLNPPHVWPAGAAREVPSQSQ